MLDKKLSKELTSNFLWNWRKLPLKHSVCCSEAYDTNTLSRAHVFKLYKRFSEGREDVEDDEWTGHPV